MADARSIRDTGKDRLSVANTVAPHEVWQTATGKAGVFDGDAAVGSGSYQDFKTDGQWVFTKATGFKALKGGRAYWDHSANNVSYKKVNDRDFYLGRFTQDSESADTSCEIDLNADPPYDIDLARDPFSTSITGTQGLNTMGVFRRGGAHKLLMSSASEVQKMDALSKDGFARTTNAIVEMAFNVISDGAGTVVDFSLGIANGTNATDADAITEHLFVHLDANATAIKLQSKDTSTTVTATDTTTTYTEGDGVANRVEVWFDMRDEADIQCYVNGVNVLPSSVFKLDAAVGPLRLLAHLEKTSAADTYEIDVEWLRVRFAEQ